MAVLTSLTYTRSRVKQTKTHQRVRLSGTAGAASGDVFNLSHPFGYYGRTSVRGGTVWYSWSSYGAPPLIHERDTAAGCTEPRFCWSPLHRIHLVCTGSGNIEERISDDDGNTWNSPSTMFTGGTHPDIACDRWGMILRAAFVSGAIQATRQYPGEAAAGTVLSLKDSGGANLAVADDVFRIVPTPFDRWWLHCRISGEGATSLWYSTDDAATWTRTDGAVGGITGGSRPGVYGGPDGSLWAWAYAGGNLKLTRRFPGDAAWSSPITVTNDAGAALAVKDAGHSLCAGVEGPGRLILATVLSTDTTACDHWSEDDGATFKAF